MVKRFEMSMMGGMKFFHGLQVNQFSNGIFINQFKYILDILKRFRMENCDTVSTPMVEQVKLKLDLVGKPVDHTDYRSRIGSLMYVTSSRLDIVFATCDKLVCWSSKKQNYVSISTAESEYVAVSSCCAQVLWMRTHLTNYGFFYDKVPIYYDSESAIAISCNPVQHICTKHIDVRYHFIKDHVEKGSIELYFVRTKYQLVDLFTKSLPEALFKFLDDGKILLHMDLCGPMQRRNRTLVEAARTMLIFANLPSFLWAKAIATACFTHNHSIIHKRFDKTPYELMNKRKPNIKFFRVFGCSCYLLNDYEDVGKLKAKGDIEVFVGYSKDFAAFRMYNKRTLPSNEEEVFHESSESFQEESSSSSLNDDVQQSSEEVEVPSSNTQSISNNMVHNVNEASTSHNVFNERLEDAYFDASTSFHDPSNVHTFYQPYPHEKK
uniref:Reverse transcriptase Ty1/copia-type domain-containing protein n=1 Tax=Tanacetum cinerariifolium TaxID=118510 RepID=A0A699JIX2_TANCI|nr:hypothetical protein [Tanacetum cinerariifolium]